MLKSLRIAVTALCLTACVVLIAQWVRTVDNGTNFQEPLLEVRDFAVYSTDGIIWAVKAPCKYSPPTNIVVSFYIPPMYQVTPNGFASTAIHKGRGFDMQFWSYRCWIVQTPNWLPVLIAVALASVPWIRWRYSLRTMLVATTLIAVILGIIATSM